MNNYQTEIKFLSNKQQVRMRSFFIAEKIDTKSLEKTKQIFSKSPLMIPAGAEGAAAIFKYGSIVLMNVTPSEEKVFFNELKDFIVNQFENPKTEELLVEVKPDVQEYIHVDSIYIPELRIDYLLLISEVLSRNVVLDYYEAQIAKSFELIDPFAKGLKNTGYNVKIPDTRQLLRHIGTALLDQHNMVGRVEVLERPDLLWDNVTLERFFMRLMDEFEIKERHDVLERKLQLIGSTAETILNIIQTKRNLRLEWYIVVLIVIEILLFLCTLI